MTPEIFNAWMKHMRFDHYGGVKAASQALGVERCTIFRYRRGFYEDGKPCQYPFYLGYAMAAIAAGLEPWDGELPVQPAKENAHEIHA